MPTFKKLSRFLVLIVLFIVSFAVWYAWRAFPIITGYGAKNFCSAIYLQHRHPDSVLKQDLSVFPFSLASYKNNPADSSVTVSIWGFAKKKAIYRHRLGATLINERSEAEVRAQTFSLPVLPGANRDSIAWPMGDKLADTIPGNIDLPRLNKILDEAISEHFNGKFSDTRGLVVVYDGQLIAEKYAAGYDKHSLMQGWSMAKSLAATVIAVLVREGKLNLAEPAPVAKWKNTEKEKITLENILQQTTGLRFRENYTSPSDATRMLFQRADMGAYTIDRNLKHDPGTVFNYSSGNSNILSSIISSTVGEQHYSSFPYEAVFHKIGMYSLVLEPDASGKYVTSSYCWATARDYARFGLLYYNKGRWNGESILPADWVDKTIQPVEASPQKNYGYHFWLNGYSKNDTTKRWFPDVPADMFFADGFGGQDIYIIPSKKLIIVRLGLNHIDENRLIGRVIDVVSGE